MTDRLNVLFSAGEAKVDLMTVSAPGPAGTAGRHSLSFFFRGEAEREVMCQMSTSTPDTALLLASPDQVDYHWGEFSVLSSSLSSSGIIIIIMVNTSNKATIKLFDGER